MKRLLLVVLAFCFASISKAQLLTWTPEFPTENDPNQTLVITVDATKGNKGLLNHTPTDDVYVHIGVITNKSTSASDWKYVKESSFSSTNPVVKATYVSANKWSFTINGSLRSFFNVTDATEKIEKIAILFRNGAGSKKQANIDGGDMYIPIYTNDFAVRLNQPAREPKYNPTPEPQTWAVGSTFNVQAVSNKPAMMKLYHNGNTVAASSSNVQSLSGSVTITEQGLQRIIVEASDGTTTKYDTVDVFIAPTSAPVAALPAGVKDGINYDANGTSATLVLHAPGKNVVTVIGDFNNWTETNAYVMNKTPDGQKFWLRINGLIPGTEYAFQYKVDNSIKIADPYAEKILDPWNDQYITAATYPGLKPYPSGQTGIVSVLQTAMPAYNWTTTNYVRPDKRGLIIYELLLRDFLADHDWETLTDTLNYLQKLGVNAIELMPFNEFEGNLSWGYNPDFYFAPDKYYGPKNDLKRFIDMCHSKGIAVIMDIALNHSFGLSPLVQLYWDAANNRPAANNPWFNPVAKHDFNVGYDMNHESLDTRYFTSRVVQHWLQEYKIDGFRFDLSKGFTQTKTCDDNGTNCNSGAMAMYDASRVAIWKRYYDTVQLKAPGSYVILEHFAANNEETELANYGMLLWGNLNYNYRRAAAGDIANSNFEGGIYTVRGWTKPHLITYMESHDEERIIYDALQTGAVTGSYNIREINTALKRMELNSAFFFTIPGPKMIWQFGELGYDYSINYCPNGTVSNNCRLDNKPIRWDYLQNANRKNVYDVYSNIIKLRNHEWYKELFLGATAIERSLTGAFKWMKVTTDTSKLLVVGNYGTEVAFGTVTFQSAGTWYDYLNNSTFTATGAVQNIMLQPGEFHIYVNRNVNNITATPIYNVRPNENVLNARLFPNPAHETFVVQLSMPQASNVSIEVYNALGQYVTTLKNSFLVKGEHQLTFNKKTLNLNTGNYYLKIQTKTENKTVQLTIQ